MDRPLSKIIKTAPSTIAVRQLRMARIMAGLSRCELSRRSAVSQVTIAEHDPPSYSRHRRTAIASAPLQHPKEQIARPQMAER